MMDEVFVQDYEMTAIGDAIRKAGATTDKYLPSEMPEAIRDINLRLAAKKTVSGNPIVITDSAKRKPLGMKLYGKSEQKTIPGNQLFDVNVLDGYGNSSTTTYALFVEDGSIYILTNSEVGSVLGSKSGKTLRDYAPSLEVGKTYTLNANTTTGHENRRYIWFYDAGVDWAFGTSKTVTEEMLNSQVGFSADTVSGWNIISDIMLNKGTTALPWEPYVGGQASPNIDYPQEIVSAGQKMASGKNLMNLIGREINTDEGTPSNPKTLTGNSVFLGISADGYYIRSRVLSYDIKEDEVRFDIHQGAYGIGFDFAVNEGDTYSMSYTGTMVSVAFYDKDGNHLSYLSNLLYYDYIITVPSGASWMVVIFNSSEAGEFVYTDIMLNKGSTALPWEPYVGRGVNLFDGVYEKNTVLGTTGVPQSYSGRCTSSFISVLPETTYVGFTAYLRVCYYDSTKNFISYDDLSTVTRTTPAGCYYLRYNFTLDAASVQQIEKGSEATPYEPHGVNTNPVWDVGIEQTLLGGNVLDIPSKALLDSHYYGINDDGSLEVKELDGRANGSMPITQTLKAGTYTLSIPEDEKNSNLKIEVYDVVNQYFLVNWTFGTSSYVSFTLESDTEITFKAIMLDYTTVGFACHIMMNIGTEPKPFEPYTEQAVKLPYVLRDGDKVLYTKGKRVQNRNKIVFDGSDDEVWHVWGSGYAIYILDAKAPTNLAMNANALCSHAILNCYASVFEGGRGFGIGIYEGRPLCIFNSELNTKEEWLQFLCENPITVEYEVADPIEIDLTPEEIAAYKAIKMNSPNTTIINSANADQEVEYVVEPEIITV